jgi:hypothetical protein
MPLTPRECVQAVLQHETPDRVPIVLCASNATGISIPAYRKLKQRLGIQSDEKYLNDWPELGTTALDEEVLERLHMARYERSDPRCACENRGTEAGGRKQVSDSRSALAGVPAREYPCHGGCSN